MIHNIPFSFYILKKCKKNYILGFLIFVYDLVTLFISSVFWLTSSNSDFLEVSKIETTVVVSNAVAVVVSSGVVVVLRTGVVVVWDDVDISSFSNFLKEKNFKMIF